jgi:hypothetical protein
MKNKILATLATLGLISSASAIEINDNLSINGFIDGSYVHDEQKNPGAASTDSSSLGIDEVELNFLLNVGNASGAIHIDNNNERFYLDSFTQGSATTLGTVNIPTELASQSLRGVDANGTASTLGTLGAPSSASGRNQNDLDIEQAYFSYAFDNGLSVTFGRYGSALGFEREDPAGLYTFSRAYGDSDYNLGNVDAAVVEGITFAYAGEGYSIAASFEENAGADLEVADLNVELYATYTAIENVAIGLGYLIDNADTAQADRDIFNVHASYSFGKGLVAAEYISIDNGGVATRGEDAFMLLADYDFTEQIGAAIRYSEAEVSNTQDFTQFTIAPNYAITESLGAIIEYSDYEIDNGTDGEIFAVELTYTF